MARKILSAAILAGLALSFSTPADAEFGVGADVVSRYVWRGQLSDDNVAVQPSLSYSHGDLEIGAWSSWALASSEANENDLYVTYAGLPVTLTVTDYYNPKAGEDFFKYGDKDGIHQLEVMGSYSQGQIGITAAAIVSGAKPDVTTVTVTVPATEDAMANGDSSATTTTTTTSKSVKPIFVEGSYELMSDDDTSASLSAALGTKGYTTDRDLALISVGLSVTKGDYTAQYILNPDAKQSWMVFMMSF